MYFLIEKTKRRKIMMKDNQIIDLIMRVEEYADQLELSQKQRKWFVMGAIFGLLYMRGMHMSKKYKKMFRKHISLSSKGKEPSTWPKNRHCDLKTALNESFFFALLIFKYHLKNN